jgi:hypothetical protein
LLESVVITLTSGLLGLISDGIYDTIGTAFAVTAAGGNFLNLGSGRSWFNHTWTKNDATVVYEAPASEVLLNRYDCMVLEIDHSDAVRNNRIFIMSGTPASSPSLPVMAAGPLKYQYIIADVYRAAGSTEIQQINITPHQGTVQTPFVNALVEKFDISAILLQYSERANELIDDLEAAYLVMQQTGIPVHHGTHASGSSDPIPPASIGAASLTGGKVTPTEASSAIATYTASHTLALADAGKLLREDSTGAIVVTIPTNATVAFPVGTEIEICRWNTGAVIFSFASGVNWGSLDGLSSISGMYGVAALKQISNNVWLLAGALA